MSAWIRDLTRWAVYLRDDLLCVYCGITAQEMADGGDNFLTLDHVKSRKKRGTHSPENLITCCYVCNNAKGVQTLKFLCEQRGWNYRRLRDRVWRNRRRDIQRFREAARVLTGEYEGIPRAGIVDLMRWRARAQWASGDEAEDWNRLDLVACEACGRIVSSQQEELPF